MTLLLSWTMAAAMAGDGQPAKAANAEKQKSLLVCMKDGTTSRFMLREQKPVITFPQGIVLVNYLDNAEEAYMVFEPVKVDRLLMKTLEPGDVNDDSVVDVADISTVINVMAGTLEVNWMSKAADVNGDGVVDVADISAVISIMAAR